MYFFFALIRERYHSKGTDTWTRPVVVDKKHMKTFYAIVINQQFATSNSRDLREISATNRQSVRKLQNENTSQSTWRAPYVIFVKSVVTGSAAVVAWGTAVTVSKGGWILRKHVWKCACAAVWWQITGKHSSSAFIVWIAAFSKNWTSIGIIIFHK